MTTPNPMKRSRKRRRSSPLDNVIVRCDGTAEEEAEGYRVIARFLWPQIEPLVEAAAKKAYVSHEGR